MPRNRRCRRVRRMPDVTYYKPVGIPLHDLEEVVLGVDEFEAIRLKDHVRLDQETASTKMNISQPTFHRLLLEARKKVADFIINGKVLRIAGGHYIEDTSIQRQKDER